MERIVLFAGTAEGRRLSEVLAAAGIEHTVCVATEYGKIVLKRHPLVEIHQGRMNREEIGVFLKKGQFTQVIDATHPYAREITQNIKAAVEEQKADGVRLSYLRLKREQVERKDCGAVYFETNEDCAGALENTEGNILLTIGSKEVFRYCNNGEVRSRLYVRVLPSAESLALCREQGICGKQIIAMQGPFTEELNEALIRQYHISYLVTKESGVSGGYAEKIEAAERTGAKVFVIGRPKEEEGYSFAGICSELEKRCGKKISGEGRLKITLAGVGMGNENGITKEVKQAVEEADILLGAGRMLACFPDKPEKYPLYQAGEIIPYVKKVQETSMYLERQKIVVLFSGDSGFYSGCQSLYAALNKEISEGRLRASLQVLPGISSVAYLASRIGESYHDAAVYSVHGKVLCNLAKRIKRKTKTFLLTAGVQDLNRLGRELSAAGMTDCEITAGYQLSYPEERIAYLSPAECIELKEEGLYTCYIKNPCAEEAKLTHGISDRQFIRGKVPMTKEEVREVSICKLHLREHAVVYDIGSGTGSLAVEIAGLSDDIQVYAVEQKEEAVSLIEENKKMFGLQNINTIKAMAPEGLSGLPTPTHAFIGGSGGRLKEILSVLREKNGNMRMVVNAVSMETICEIREVLSQYQIREEELVQVQVSRMNQIGSHHLLQAENPVWICAFTFGGGET